MVIKNIEYYNDKIERLKISIKRLRAEKRIAVLMEREKKATEQIQKAGKTDGKHS